MRKRLYPIFFICLLFYSCDFDAIIDLDIEDHDPVLVLNGILDTDTSVQVVVSHSVGAFDNVDPSFISDATVLLYKISEGVEDEFIDSLIPDLVNVEYIYYYNNYNETSLPMYYYKSDYMPEKNTEYRIDVDHPNYDAITASTYIPEDVTLYDMSVDTVVNPEYIRFEFSFDDDPNQDNHYRMKLFASCSKEWEDDDGYVYIESWEGDVWMHSNDPSFPNNNIDLFGDVQYSFAGDEVVFSDVLFNGEKKTISVDVESDYADCDTVIIEFSNFSEDTYIYYNSLQDHIEKGELGIFGGEVIPVYSNVENGLGVLISVNAQNIQLKP
jgi:hypothetical protein